MNSISFFKDGSILKFPYYKVRMFLSVRDTTVAFSERQSLCCELLKLKWVRIFTSLDCLWSLPFLFILNYACLPAFLFHQRMSFSFLFFFLLAEKELEIGHIWTYSTLTHHNWTENWFRGIECLPLLYQCEDSRNSFVLNLCCRFKTECCVYPDWPSVLHVIWNSENRPLQLQC